MIDKNEKINKKADEIYRKIFEKKKEEIRNLFAEAQIPRWLCLAILDHTKEEIRFEMPHRRI